MILLLHLITTYWIVYKNLWVWLSNKYRSIKVAIWSGQRWLPKMLSPYAMARWRSLFRIREWFKLKKLNGCDWATRHSVLNPLHKAKQTRDRPDNWKSTWNTKCSKSRIQFNTYRLRLKEDGGEYSWCAVMILRARLGTCLILNSACTIDLVFQTTRLCFCRCLTSSWLNSPTRHWEVIVFRTVPLPIFRPKATRSGRWNLSAACGVTLAAILRHENTNQKQAGDHDLCRAFSADAAAAPLSASFTFASRPAMNWIGLKQP